MTAWRYEIYFLFFNTRREISYLLTATKYILYICKEPKPKIYKVEFWPCV